MRHRSLALALGVVLSMLAVTPAAAWDYEDYSNIVLRPADYTNGVMKSKLFAGSFTVPCHSTQPSTTWDAEVRVYYDVLDANRIHIKHVLTKYYIKRPGRLIYGGFVRIDGEPGGTVSGPNDMWKPYYFNSSNVDREGYSYAGQFDSVFQNTQSWFDNRGFFVQKYSYGNGVIAEGCTGAAIGEFRWQ